MLESTKASSAKNLKSSLKSRIVKFLPFLQKKSISKPDSETSDDSDDEDDGDLMVACPVISYSSFEDKVREIDPLASSDIIRIAGNYLQDMGEVRSFRSKH